MATPELHRSGHTPVDPDHAREMADAATPPTEQGRTGPVPPANQPGHHPAVEQDKPAPRRRPGRAQRGGPAKRFDLRFDPRLAPLARVWGISPGNAHVEVDDDTVTIRFGRWQLQTAIENIASVEITGPYRWFKIAGPPRLSLADRGITFAASTGRGLCMRFHDPVPAILPVPVVRHPSATVAVADPEALAAEISQRQERRATPKKTA